MKEFWNERYNKTAFAYGEAPNAFLSDTLLTLPTGKILFPADGEGRNSVFAAKNGFNVESFDISEAGKEKALTLAVKNGVSLNYQVGELADMNYATDSFDYLALIYAHFPATIKSAYHKQLATYLKTGGIVIFEAFSKNHLAYQQKYPTVGGPQDLAMLFSMEEIKADFSDFEIIKLEETEVALSEGIYHQGIGSVIRFIGKKL
jgi:2-polyprenyl-3-methyl-5-hydroxy-6-metoxy-1,4-benzoquinol methylase